MKTHELRITILILLTSITISAKSQTNVSGGIYTNTTWTHANSPYIVTDTVVVFPGVTLTIEPGVVVRFNDHTYIEIRNASLIALGTQTDSITFTSNSATPVPGIWGHQNNGGIWLSTTYSVFNFCNISYATQGINLLQLLPAIKNSTFTHNQYGIQSVSRTRVDSCVFKFNDTAIENLSDSSFNFNIVSNNYYGIYYASHVELNNCIIDSNYEGMGGIVPDISDTKLHHCSIKYNRNGFVADGNGGNLLSYCVIDSNIVRGVYMGHHTQDSIMYCEIKYNGTGVGAGGNTLITHCDIEYDTIGVYGCANLICNKICNNISYGLQNGSGTCDAAHNYWCTSDSTLIASAIYDGYDNINLGLVNFFPLDTACAPGITTSVDQITNNNLPYLIFPNPTAGNLSVELSSIGYKAEIRIFNSIGDLEFSSVIPNQKYFLDISSLISGIYIVELISEEKIFWQKLIRE